MNKQVIEMLFCTLLHIPALSTILFLFSMNENLPNLSGIPDFFICQILFFFSGYDHCHISDSPNFIKNIFRIFFLSGDSHLWFSV